MAELEVVSRGGHDASRRPPLLFVHGGMHAAWCWDEHFLKFFADNGFRAVAVSLRGHGGSRGAEAVTRASITDYVDDVATVAERLGSAPIMIGHSLGGFVVQKYLESHRSPAAVLVASAPPNGLGRFLARIMLRLVRRHPWLFVTSALRGRSMQMLRYPDTARDAFFSVDAPEADVVRYASRFDEESLRAILHTTLAYRVKPQHISTPMLILGAQCDRLISINEVLTTARVYHAEAEIFAHMAHDMMLEPGWNMVAARIRDWLLSQAL